jgi:hypothetical protein
MKLFAACPFTRWPLASSQPFKNPTGLLASLEENGVQMVARLPPLPDTVLQGWSALLGGADAGLAYAAAFVLRGLVQAGDDQAARVVSTAGFPQVGAVRPPWPPDRVALSSRSAPAFAQAFNPATTLLRAL